VVGYYRPVGRWNKGKQEEYRDRVEYSTQSFCSPACEPAA
jgi:ribonucleoside-triphosphate reductase